MDTYIGERAANGVFLDGGGLYGTEDAVNFVVRKGEVTRVDGPYAEAKEVVGGWSLLEYPSLEEAVADQEEFARLHAEHWPEVTVVATLRQISGGPGGSRGLITTLAACRQTTTTEAVHAAWRADSARLVGALTRMTRDVELAADLAQDALVAALEQWPVRRASPRTPPRG